MILSMNFLINMLSHVNQLHKLVICLTYAQLTNSSVNNENFAQQFETQFHQDVSTAYIYHISSNILYIIIYYYYIYLYTASSLTLSFYHVIEISTAYTQLLLIHLFILSLCLNSKAIEYSERQASYCEKKHTCTAYAIIRLQFQYTDAHISHICKFSISFAYANIS